jgi:tetratricopeptide (TPR) repeat protein
MQQARANPDQGFETASEWRDHGGGFPAEHCVAIALVGLKQYPEAAHRLETLAQSMVKEAPPLRAQVMSQAAEAWSEAGEPKSAEADLAEAIRLDPGNADFVVSRSAARADQKNYAGAIDDLNSIVRRGIERADVYAFRAASYRLSGDLKDAAADAERAVQLGPTLPEAWLERANVRRLAGNTAGARQDWLEVIRLAPESAAADSARRNLETLDVHPDGTGTPSQSDSDK